MKMTSYSEILVLIANDNNATLCANADGETRILRTIERFWPATDRSCDTESAFDAKRFFASELMMALSRGVREHAYDGVVIFADAPMMEELRQVQTNAISRALIAEIIGMPSEVGHFPGRSAANTEMAYRGALQ